MFYTYVLYSKSLYKIYIGYSENPQKRLKAHNEDRNIGWTKGYQPWEIIHLEEFKIKAEALEREKQLKSLQGRKFIRSLPIS